MQHYDGQQSMRRRARVRFELGRSRSGRWILRDAEGLGYAVFSTCDAAVSYALEETGGAQDAIIPCPDGLESGFSSATR